MAPTTSCSTTIRDYAKERLTEAGEAEPLRRAHLRYFTALAEEIGPLVDGGSPEPGREGRHGLEELLDQLDLSRPDIRVALDFAQESGDTVAALRIAGQLGRYAYLRGHYHEVRDWMDQAVVAGEGGPAELRAKALLGSGRLALLQCDYGPAVRRLEAALRLYRERADPAGIASALQVLGSVAREQGRYARSMELHAESLSIAERAGDRRAVASARGYLGFVAWLQCDFGRAIAECTAALDQFRELGDVEGTAWSLLSLGTVARYQGDAGRAAALLGDSRSLAESIGFREGVAWSLEQLGLLAASQDDPAAHRTAEPQPGDPPRAAGPVADVQRAGGSGRGRAHGQGDGHRDRARRGAARGGRGDPGGDRHGDPAVRAGPA